MSQDPKAQWKAAYAAQQNQCWSELCDQLSEGRKALIEKLQEEYSWKHASRKAWLAFLSQRLINGSVPQGQLMPEQASSIENLVTQLNTRYQQQPFYKRWWWYFRYRWWRVQEMATAGKVLSVLQEDKLKLGNYAQLKSFMRGVLKQMSRWNWLYKVVKPMEAKISQAVVIERKPVILTKLEKLWNQGLAKLKQYGSNTLVHEEAFLGVTTNRRMLKTLKLTEITACENQRHALAQTAIEKGRLGEYGWIGGSNQDEQLTQTRELVYYRLLEDCMQQLLEKQANYWKKADGYRKQEQKDKLEDTSAMQNELAGMYESWHGEMMRWMSLCREGLCIAIASRSSAQLWTIYQVMAKEVLQLVEDNEQEMDNKWGGVLISIKDRLKAILTYDEWLKGNENKKKSTEADEGIILVRFIEQVNSLNELLKDERGDTELKQALAVKAEALKQYDMQKLGLQGIGCGTFEVPVEKLAKELNGLVERYQQSIAENNQLLIKAAVQIKEQENNPADVYEITSELIVELRIEDEILRHWLRAEGGEEEQRIKQDFLRNLRELAQLKQAMMWQAEDKAACEAIINKLKACSKTYSVKYHPDKIRTILKEDIATKMFITFRDHLERATSGESHFASAGQAYGHDPYFEEIIRLTEKLSRLIEKNIQQIEKNRQEIEKERQEIEQERQEIEKARQERIHFYQEKDKQLGEARKEIEELAKAVKEMRETEKQSKSNLNNTPESVIEAHREQSVAKSNTTEKAVRLSAEFTTKYDPGFWEHPKADISVEHVAKRSKQQVQL